MPTERTTWFRSGRVSVNANRTDPEPRRLTFGVTPELVHVSLMTVYRWIRRAELPAIRFGDSVAAGDQLEDRPHRLPRPVARDHAPRSTGAPLIDLPTRRPVAGSASRRSI